MVPETKDVGNRPITEINLCTEYGTPEDYEAAIQQLREALPPDGVSTEWEVLETHGQAIGCTRSEFFSFNVAF